MVELCGKEVVSKLGIQRLEAAWTLVSQAKLGAYSISKVKPRNPVFQSGPKVR